MGWGCLHLCDLVHLPLGLCIFCNFSVEDDCLTGLEKQEKMHPFTVLTAALTLMALEMFVPLDKTLTDVFGSPI